MSSSRSVSPSPPLNNDAEVEFLLVASPVSHHICTTTTTHASQESAGQYYMLLADITHTGYQKLVEPPLERSSTPQPISSSPETPFLVSSSLQSHCQQQEQTAAAQNPMGKALEKMKKTTKKEYQQYLKILLAEFLGTAMLVCFGCLGCVTGLSSHFSPMQPAINFGFVVASVIQIFVHISGAHVNPAVSLSGVLQGVITWIEFLVYFLAQMCGAVAGYGLLMLVTPHKIIMEDTGDHGFCMTLPNNEINDFQAFLVEFLATMFLILVLCSAWDKRNATKHDSLPIKFGLVIIVLALTAGPYTGASMNPARSFGPAFWNGSWKSHWLYWTAPVLSSIATSLAYRFVFKVDEVEETDNAGADHVPLSMLRHDTD